MRLNLPSRISFAQTLTPPPPQYAALMADQGTRGTYASPKNSMLTLPSTIENKALKLPDVEILPSGLKHLYIFRLSSEITRARHFLF